MKPWTKIWLVLCILMTWIISAPSLAEVVDRVVAVVNEEPITLYQLDKLMAENIDKIKSISGGKDQKKAFKNYRSMALKSLIDEKLLDQEIAKRNIQVTKADEEKALNNVLRRNNITEQELAKELRAKGRSYEEYRNELKGQMKKIKFMGQVIAPRVKVTDADLDEFFAKNSAKFARFQSVEMAQIILPLKVDATGEELQMANKLAAEVVKKARGGANFEDLGKKYSINPQTAMKSLYQVSQLAPQIGALLSEMRPGGVSDPVRSSLGLHVVKLYSRKTLAGEEYKVIREQLREQVFEYKLQEEMEEYLDDLKAQSYIEIKKAS